ncbi:PREDICTED: uncharacterized protein LOC108782911 [Cyphomyrmex costatus]|uniref:uncharacterized protein LOC108782911 n=1 Tax=Cyphomyrmex costatus TaxID=456900 RepID=UPI0008522520|nr:PREDICTED: uncharacterized protein LOC108782911 [Cyphomyrmex costatus]
MNGEQTNDVQMNGLQLNGVQLNGVQTNGVQMNGPHKIAACRTTKRCLKCGNKHHTTIHQNTQSKTKASTPVASASENSSESKSSEVHTLHSSTEQHSVTSCVLLATAQVVAIAENGENLKARVLIDQGSEISLISERLVQLLHLPRKHSSISLIGIGGLKTNNTNGLTQFKIRPHFDHNTEIFISAHILPKLTTSLPSVKVHQHDWPHLKGLTLADYHYATPGSIDIILGAYVYSQIIEEGLIKGDTTSPIAQRTKLGWILSGPFNNNKASEISQGYHISVDKDLHDLLQRFWKLEEVSSTTTSLLSIEVQECEQHYKQTHSRDQQGRYIVRLPFKRSANELGDSRKKALHIMFNLFKKQTSDSNYATAYSEFLREYERLDHMIQVPKGQLEPELVYYLPHHGVIR